jgi:subtilase family serine protease
MNFTPAHLIPIDLVQPEVGITSDGLGTYIPSYLAPPAIATAYSIPASTGYGVKIAIFSFGGGFLQSDLNKSFADLQSAGLINSSLTVPTIRQVLLDGQTGNWTNGGADGENTVDIYCTATMAPQAQISIYIGSYLSSMVAQALADQVHICTMSWGSGEYTSDESNLQTLASAKITFLASSGDYGSVLENSASSSTGTVGSITGTGPWTATISGLVTNTAFNFVTGQTLLATSGTGSLYGGTPTSCVVSSIVNQNTITFTVTGGTTPVAGSITNVHQLGIKQVTYPASSPYCIGVGGTHLYINSSYARTSEADDNEDPGFPSGWGGGGGLSSVFSKPSWQIGGLYYTPITNSVTGSPTALTVRGVPDWAAPMSAYIYYQNGTYAAAGGTSLSCPTLAGIMARYLQLTGVKRSSVDWNTIAYANQSAFYDITVGNDTNSATYNYNGYIGTTGWDPITGLGPPIGTLIYQLIRTGTVFPKQNYGFRPSTGPTYPRKTTGAR